MPIRVSAMGVEERAQAALVAVAELGGQHRCGLSRGAVSLLVGHLRASVMVAITNCITTNTRDHPK
jgi:hypothetical protein